MKESTIESLGHDLLRHPTQIAHGEPTLINPNLDAETRRGLIRENESAQILARAGYQVEQNPVSPGSKEPDYRIEGRIFDNYAPSTSRVRNIWDLIRREKVEEGQTNRIILNLNDCVATIPDLRKQFKDWPMPKLKEVIAVRADEVIPLWP